MAPDRAAVVVLCVAAAVLLWPPGSPVAARLQAVAARSSQRHRRGRLLARARRPAPGRRRLLVAAVAGVGVAALLGGVLGVLAGAGTAVGAERVLRRSAAAAGAWSAADLPLACDLLDVCLAAGLPVPHAVGAVAGVVGEPLRAALTDVAARYRLGAEPRQAWAGAPAELAGLARVVERAGRSGSAVGRSLRDLASDARAAERSVLDTRVRRAGVQLLAPLGACFLPAFLCLGVVPLVLGIAGHVFR